MRLLQRTGGGAHVGCPQVHRAVFTGCLRGVRSRSIAALRGDLCRGGAAGEVGSRDAPQELPRRYPPGRSDAVGRLKSLGEASRRDDGNLRYEIVQQTNRPNHFTVIEIWASREAFDAHGMAPHVREFRDRLAPMSGALYDERLYETVN